MVARFASSASSVSEYSRPTAIGACAGEADGELAWREQFLDDMGTLDAMPENRGRPPGPDRWATDFDPDYRSACAICTMAFAISSGERMKSTNPLATALSGMPGCRAVSRRCAIVVPPTSLMARRASAPSPS
jgi:hypothetical protein